RGQPPDNVRACRNEPQRNARRALHVNRNGSTSSKSEFSCRSETNLIPGFCLRSANVKQQKLPTLKALLAEAHTKKMQQSHQIFWHVKGQSFEGTLKFLNESAASLGIRQQIPQDLMEHWRRSRPTKWLERNPLLI